TNLAPTHVPTRSKPRIHVHFVSQPTPTTAIYTLSLHYALPISSGFHGEAFRSRKPAFGGSRLPDDGWTVSQGAAAGDRRRAFDRDRKSTRLNSSHSQSSYAVFCLKKKKRIANGVRGAILRDGTRDTGCGLKAFPRDLFLRLPYFDCLHRFLPALCKREVCDIGYVD